MCGIITLKYDVEYGYYRMPIVYDISVPYKTTDVIKVDEKEYTVFYYKFWNFQEVMKYVFPKMNRIKRLFTRGLTDDSFIYALEKDHWYSDIAHDRMLKHEVGHIENKGIHRWWVPDLMNPSWLFRWSDKIW